MGILSKINQVLFLVILLTVVGMIGYFVLDDMAANRARRHNGVATTPEKTEISYRVDPEFQARGGGTYAFAIVREPAKDSESPSSFSSRSGEPFRQTVNFNFVRDGRKARSLLPSNALVVSQNLAHPNEIHHYGPAAEDTPFAQWLFCCVTEDTNHDGQLAPNDRQDLYIVDPKLAKPDMVIQDVLTYHILNDHQLLVPTGDSDNPRYLLVDIGARTRTEIPWK